MSGAGLRASVVIPTHGRPASVVRALAALGRQSLAADAYEVIVVVDGADEETVDAVRALTTPYLCRVLERPRAGRAAACNAGIAAASGAVVVLLDDDMEASPRLLDAHLAAQEAADPATAGRAVVGAAPIDVPRDADPFVRYVAEGFEERLARLARPGYRLEFRDAYTGNFSCRRAVLRSVGGFDEEFAVYGHEDYELALRLLAADVELVYDSEALARQHYEKRFAAFAADGVERGRTAVLFAEKHPEVADHLRLGGYYDVDWKWRLLRGALLALDRVTDRVPGRVVAVIGRLERRRSPRLHKYYRLAIDYLFWHGAFRARREHVRRRRDRWPLVRVRIALALVLLYSAVSATRWVDTAAGWPRDGHVDEISANDARFAEIAGALPASGQVGYLGDPALGGDTPRERNDRALAHFRRYLLAQYALAPVVLVESTEPDLVIGNFDAASVPAAPDGFELARDFGDGVVLYRRVDR